jgi:hypothetical protein
MKRQSARVHIVIASLLTLLLVALSAAPTTAAEPRRAHGAEDMAFRLVNCLRTGGKITEAGSCKGRGSGRYSAKRTALKRSERISNKVAWPWAKRTAKLYSNRTCWVGHSLAGSTVDRRFAAAGLKHGVNGENVGCAAYDPQRMVKFIVRWWQREKAYGGWHWRQLKDGRYKSMGVAVARRGNGKAQLVVNFYSKVVR